MQARVAELGLSDRFRFLGFRPDAPRAVQAFDVVAVPSHVEPFGLAALEAMAAGRPVVASRVGGLPEIVLDGRTGVLVPPRDAAALARGIAGLLDDPALMAAMGEAGRLRASKVFSLGAHGEAMQSLYDRLIGSRP
jgi:glycosyltransferase involved in cell wall biosynthesis